MITTRIVRPALAFALVAAVLAGCGGGGADTTPRTKITAVKTFGDSLADTGTFGIRFTIQPTTGNPNYIYPELVAQQYGIAATCNYYVSAGFTSPFSVNSKEGCVNYAVGGGVINGAASSVAGTPYDIPMQLADATKNGNFSASDLLLIVGGGNDAAALTGAYLGAAKDRGVAYVGMLSTLLNQNQLAAATANSSALAAAGSTYMVALADKFYNTIKTTALDKGAQRIVLINMPGITNTPRFQAVLGGVAAANGGGPVGAAARAQVDGLINSWVVAFNTQLASKFAGESRVVLVDLYSNFNDQVANPAQYKMTNVMTPACPAVGLDASGLPVYSFPTCTDASLAANKPTGATASDWYKSYMFSDGFHPTPYGHQLASQLIARSLAQKGWL